MEARLTVEAGSAPGSEYAIQPGPTRILGRGPGAHIVFRDPGLAPRHAALRLEAERLRAVDLGSPAGTFVEEQRLPPQVPVELPPGCALRLGSQILRVELLGPDGRPIFAGGVPAGPPLPEIPGYQLLRELGRGAMGRVLAARRLADGCPVALKVLHEGIAPGSLQHERFLREGQLTARLRSPYLVAVLEHRLVGGHAIIAMEWIDGPSLEARLAQGPLSIPDVLRVGEHVAQGLAVAAAAGIVHRDVKPANVLLAPEGVAKLTDFGIAKDLDSTLRSLTVSGQGLGTLAYLPPEQVDEAKHVDPRADLYALGATLYHALAGAPPFRPGDVASLFRIMDEEPPPLSSRRPDAPPALVDLVHRLLAKDPFDRPPNARRLVRALRRLGGT